MKLYIALIAILTLLNGCSTMNAFLYEKKCTAGDWEALGYSDGKQGKSRGDFAGWKQKCQQFGSSPVKESYMAGVGKGVSAFCTDKGLALGKSGERSSVPSQCFSTTNKNSFNSAYAQGVQDFCNYDNGLKLAEKGKARPLACAGNKQFSEGYSFGLKAYCSSENAFEAGKNNVKEYPVGVCPLIKRMSVSRSFENGKKIQGLEARVANLDREIADIEGKMYDPKVPADVKGHYRNILSTKKAELRTTERELYKISR